MHTTLLMEFTEFKGIMVHRTLTKSMLSPLVWNLAFDDFLNRFNTGLVWARGFADDGMALIVRGPVLSALVKRGQEGINTAMEFGQCNGPEFSIEKTVVVIFTKRKVKQEVQKLRMGSTEIEYSDRVTYFGVVLDRQLTFGPPITERATKASS